jgi:hypothetical protein
MPPALLLATRTYRLPTLRPCLRALARAAPRRTAASSASSPHDPPPPQGAMEAPLRAAIEAIHATPVQAVLYLAGGGAQARTDCPMQLQPLSHWGCRTCARC